MTAKEKLTELICESDRAEMEYDEMAELVIANGFVDLSHIMQIEFVEDYGALQMRKVALYNKNHVTEKEALQIVKAGEENPFVLVLTERKFSCLFLDNN